MLIRLPHRPCLRQNASAAVKSINSRADLECWQTDRLRTLVAEVVPRNPFWRSRFASAGITPEQIQSLDDLRRIPFTEKAEILADQAMYPPYGSNLSFDCHSYSRLHQTSGTTGTPLRWLDTPASWEWILQTWGQLFSLMGLRDDDRLLFPFSFGPFLGFWAGFEGANRLGNLCIAAGGMNSLARLHLLRDNEVTVVCCTPTYATRLAEVAAEHDFDLKSSAVRAILVAGEPGGNIPATRRLIETTWGAQVVDHWGMTEIGPLAIESLDRPGGLYVLETECIAEIIDPQSGNSVGPGVEGELVITNLGRVGSPLFRYRTGDRVCAGTEDQSATGPVPPDPSPIRSIRPHLLYLPGGILGRIDEMLTIRGNNLYPAALEDVIRQFPDVAEFRMELSTLRGMQHLRIEIEPSPQLDPGAAGGLALRIADTIKSRWHFQAEVVAVPSGSLPRFEMKARRFFRLPR